MHAVVGIFQMDTSKFEQQTQELTDRIIPMVKHQPGFVTGYWSRATDGQSFSYIVWQTEAQAKAMCGMVEQGVSKQADHGVTLTSLTVVEVVGSA